jgi:hypothetical protein
MLAALLSALAASAAPPKPVPPSPYLAIAYSYADALLKHGRDVQGPQKTGLFLSALDREKLAPLGERPPALAGIEESLRVARMSPPIAAASPAHDENLLRLLYTLSELSFKPTYRDAADAELTWVLKNLPPGDACRALGDAGYAWNALADAELPSERPALFDNPRPWMLWDRCFDLAPDASKAAVIALAEARVDDRRTISQTGYSLRAYAVAYRRTRGPTFAEAVAKESATIEKFLTISPPAADGQWVRGSEVVSAAIDCHGAAGLVPPPLARRLAALARRADDAFLAWRHDLSGKGGFAVGPAKNAATTSRWAVAHRAATTAAVAMLCVARYENTGDVRYRELIRAAADAYKDSLPGEDADAWPMTFGHAISLQLAAWRSTSRLEYLERAIRLADEAVKVFCSDSPLPSATARSRHYESITGGDTLALSLVELHLSILHITAVRSPPNTIDR